MCHNVSIELANSLINQPWLQFRDQLELEATKWPNLKVYVYKLLFDIIQVNEKMKYLITLLCFVKDQIFLKITILETFE